MGRSGRKQEHDMRRRLFQRFQQRIECLVGQHMHFVDDIGAHLQRCRRIVHLFADLADVVHTVVGSRVNFYDIGGSSGLDSLTGRAGVAGTSVHRMFAVDCLCQNLRHRSLTCPAGSAEQVSMADTSGFHLIFQGGHNVILALHILKGGGPEFPIQSSITHEVTPVSA